MRGALLVALSLLAACSAPLPPGVERLDGDAALHSFAWSPQSRRLAFVDGRFPNRTYLVVVDRASRARSRRRFKGYVLGGKVALSRDGRRVLLEAGKIAPDAASRSEPSRRSVLLVDADHGAILAEEDIGSGNIVTLGHPAWSADPIAVWNGRKGVNWKGFGAEGKSGVLERPGAWRALLLDAPYLIVAERQTDRPRMSVYDLTDGKQTAEWRVALTGSPLALRPDGSALSARWMSESGTYTLEAGDPKTGRRVPLLESQGEIESALETPNALYAIAKDPARRNTTGKSFLAPRVLLVAESGGQRWSVPWTSHEGEFIGVDPANGRLMFAMTDRDHPGVWALAPTRSALTAAGAAIDAR